MFAGGGISSSVADGGGALIFAVLHCSPLKVRVCSSPPKIESQCGPFNQSRAPYSNKYPHPNDTQFNGPAVVTGISPFSG